MKSVILFVLFVALCSAEDTVKWAGTTAGGATFAIPEWSSATPSVCSASTTQAPYVYFNVTFATAGIREVAALAERDYKSNLRIFVYKGTFDPAAPCTNLLSDALTKQTGFQGGPVVDDYVYFEAATYQFIVTSSTTDGGLFAVNIFPSIAAGQLTNDGSVWWAYPSIYNGECTSDTDYATPVGWFSWTQPTTGFFDILASFANTTDDDIEVTAVLFQGTPSAAGLMQDPCNNTATGATFITGINGDSRGALIPYANLTAGWNYTVAFSGESGEIAYWGVQVNPTRIRFFHPEGYTQPDRSFDPTDPTDLCAPSSSYDNAAWDSTLFLTEQRAYLLDTSQVPYPFSNVDTYSFLYEGYNTGSDTTAPSACPLGASLVSLGDTGDITPVYALTNPGVNYTVVVSTYGGGQVTDPTVAYLLYLFTGTPIGALPPATTGQPTTTTASGTDSGTATGTPTGGSGTGTGSPTGGSGTTGNQPVSTTSGASSIVVGFIAVVAIFATLL